MSQESEVRITNLPEFETKVVEDFTSNQICSYELIWPDDEQMTEKDKVILETKSIKGAVLYLAYGLAVLM